MLAVDKTESLLYMFSCEGNNVFNYFFRYKKQGNCLIIDSIFPIYVKNSVFFNNIIDDDSCLNYGGNPCIITLNLLSILYINESNFKNNQAFDQSNCLNFVGTILHINNSFFEGMKSISNPPNLDNFGTLSLSADNLIIFNVSLIKNKAFKAAGIFFNNMNGQQQNIYCEKVL